MADVMFAECQKDGGGERIGPLRLAKRTGSKRVSIVVILAFVLALPGSADLLAIIHKDSGSCQCWVKF